MVAADSQSGRAEASAPRDRDKIPRYSRQRRRGQGVSAPAQTATVSERTAPPPVGPRADIQGLRALAVLLVILDHLWGWPAGGFIGVDVFFVLSGFLITGLLLNANQRGSISFLDFYRRRIRRIIPAAVLVITATIGATYALIGKARGDVVAEDGIWAFFFASNWHYGAIGTDYWANSTITSPLQHFWSLAVEEQFYLVWPWVMVGFLGFGASAAGRGLRTRAGLFVATVALVIGLFVYSIWHTETAPLWAYFSTLDRAWELGAGALLAMVRPRLRLISTPNGIRTRATAVKGRGPGPLDDGGRDVHAEA